MNLLSSNYPSYIGRSLSNGRLIQEDDNNETRALCFKCIVLLMEARKFEEAQKLNARMSDMLAVLPPTARMEASPQKLEARSVPPMTRREDFLGQLKCDWLDTPPTPPYSRKTRSSGAKRDDGKSAIWIKACVQAVKNEDSC